MADNIKLTIAALILVLGIVAFYYFGTSTLISTLIVLGTLAAAIAVGYPTAFGRSLWDFLKASRTELRKVVWPTNKETMQVTFVVFGMVVLVAVFLWVVDWGLLKFMRALTGRGA